MPESPGKIEEIHNSLKASLNRGKSQHDLDKDVVAASKRVLLEHIAFEPASAPYTMQLDQLRAKYIPLNAGSTSASHSAENSVNGQPKMQHGGSSAGNPASSPGGGDSLPQPKVVLYPEDRVRMEWLRQGRIGAGLVNMGNTCFFNSTLQCLTYTAPLVNYCFSNDHKQKCTKNGFCMMCEIQNHIRTSLECGGKSIKPHSILQKLRCIAKHMKWGRQEDAHEFLRFVVDHLQQACLNGHSKLDRFSKETTVINQIFGGYLQSQVICLRCQARSNTFDPFMDISLDIKGVNTVEEALLKFVKPETLDQENAYKCPKCKHKVRAQKRFSIYKAPNVLTLQLNRFDFNRQLSGKINRFIRYTEKINIRNYMSQRQGEPILYHLYGVLVHSGYSSEHGHYYSFVKSPSKIWYCMNDSIVHQAGNNAVFSADAYVLFYARINKSVGADNRAAPSATSSSNHSSKLLNPQNKASFIGPVIPTHLKQTSPQPLNGLHGTPSSEQGTPVKRQNPMMLPRTLQTSNGARPRSSSSLTSPSTSAQTPQATATSSLPGSHNRISFPILSTQQKRQQQQHGMSQNHEHQTGEDGKRIVLQIKHGNSTTMEKSSGGKPESVPKRSNGGTAHTHHQSAVNHAKPVGLVPYYDDDDSDSDSHNDIRRPLISTEKKKNGSHKENKEVQAHSSLPLSGNPRNNLQSLKGQSPETKPSGKINGDNPKKLLNGSSSTNVFSPNHKKFADVTPKANSSVSPGFARSLSSSPLPVKPAAEERKWLLNRQHSASPSRLAASASVLLSSPGKAGLIAPLELPVVTSSSASHSSFGGVVKTSSSGTWHIQPQDTGVPSPRGSCSSANSVNSTTEWTLQSKGKSEAAHLTKFKTENGESCKRKLEPFKPQEMYKTKSLPETVNGHNIMESKGHDRKQSVSELQSLPTSSQPHNHKVVSASPPMARPETPVDISDRLGLLSSPPSSQTSESSRTSKKYKKTKHHYREEKDDKERKKKMEINGRGGGEHSRSSSQDSSERRKKKRKHKKEKKRRRNPSLSDSESEREERQRHGKKHYSRMSSGSDSDTRDSNNNGALKRHKQRGRGEEEEDYEWVEVTKESSMGKHKKCSSSNRAPVQAWNHHVKDDVAPKRDSEASKLKSTWDGSRHSKVAAALHGSSYSLGSHVLSWDGDKNHLDRDLQAERAAKKRLWSDEYNQEIDAGKVKKVKKQKSDSDFHSDNRFQKYQEYRTDMARQKHRDHSYHLDHYNHNSWHRKRDRDRVFH
ncbi:ubiquitin carboxyl-terminal hydrolase [Elysia marginata]|uniref:Ubiquitin carboxyl-terminal hydrolase 36 n=1 Tax=Elysia marginata TaxID=1093978 RepID=A0AAV4IUM1_9GAST|nr:ubiquitin carboxyl-terminal hydrolase [Elysia marginata]